MTKSILSTLLLINHLENFLFIFFNLKKIKTDLRPTFRYPINITTLPYPLSLVYLLTGGVVNAMLSNIY